jgi:hypothetical protein
MANEFDAEGWIERAAIIEYEGGKTREAAERMTEQLLGAYLGQTKEAEDTRKAL